MRVTAPGTVAARVSRERVQRRTLRVLVTGQILGGAAIGVGAAVSPLLAKDILGADTYAGTAFSAFVLGAALAAVPLSRLMARRGRRAGLALGYGVAGVGAAGVVLAAEVSSFWLLLVSLVAFGAGNAANLLARYAGADLAEPHRRARSIAVVVWATTIGAIAGPNLIGPAGRLAAALDLPRLAGPYLLGSAWSLAAAAAIAAWLRPDPMVVAGLVDIERPERSRSSVRRQLGLVLASPPATLGMTTMAVAHGVMVAIMTMTPLHLQDHGGSLQLVGVVISLHVAGMYAFAPLMGLLADRAGPVRLARAAAAALMLAASSAAIAGHSHVLIGASLVLLGLGWSAATISGAALISGGVEPADRARVQGAADLTMGLVAVACGVGASVVTAALGYAVLSLLGAVLTGVVLGAAIARAAAAGPSPAAATVPAPAAAAPVTGDSLPSLRG